MKKIKVMTVTPNNQQSGKKELKKYCSLALEAGVEMLVFPSSFLPYYKNTNAFYVQKDIEQLSKELSPNILVIVGVNEKTLEGDKYKSVIGIMDGKIFIHRKRFLENHYIQKGFEPGKQPLCPFVYKNFRIQMLECYECLFPELWVNPKDSVDIVTVSIGFGMKAHTKNYNCDYFEKWLKIIQTGCIRNNCYCILSCNGQHEDFMTVVINDKGTMIGCARNHGYVVIDVERDSTKPINNPYFQGD